MKRLTEEAKDKIVEKALNSNGRSLVEIAGSHNIGYSTLQKWLKSYRENTQVKQSRSPRFASKPLTHEERFSHLVATAQLDEVSVGAYCREHGLYSVQLQQWKEEVMSAHKKSEKRDQSAELKELRLENKQLKRELKRKDSALAETAALLVLKKKAALIWGEPKDD